MKRKMVAYRYQCSATCGKGVKMREVACKNSQDEAVSPFMCPRDQQPKNVRPCQLEDCSQFVWSVGAWSEVCLGPISCLSVCLCLSSSLCLPVCLCLSIHHELGKQFSLVISNGHFMFCHEMSKNCLL